jgi:hypothetical protein
MSNKTNTLEPTFKTACDDLLALCQHQINVINYLIQLVESGQVAPSEGPNVGGLIQSPDNHPPGKILII